MNRNISNLIFALPLWAVLFFSSCENSILKGWWNKNDTETPKLVDPPPSANLLTGKLSVILAWIRDNAEDNGHYAIRIEDDDSILPEEGRLFYPGKTGIKIEIAGIDRERVVTITGNATGSLFDIGKDVTFVLDQYITLKGHDSNNTSLVMVSSGGTLIMNDGAAVRDNVNTTIPSSDWRGSGISVDGTFIMDGGSVTGNRCNNGGGGVGVLSGTFIMNNGSITNNEAATDGGGVQIQSGSFTMSGGIISGNKVTSANLSGSWVVGGGGVYISSNDSSGFTKNGGVIYGSDAPGSLANVVTDRSAGGGDAVYAYRNGRKVRNSTLYENDNISTTNWNTGWE